ncbi:Spermidine Putrescine ABC transporter permease component PotB [Caenispirillum salinarum AK4]|uniref:Spermidine Putrescine ABC transporter permease component PotB n=1 Tax=Caenispirillum salinarum AK4 TaxID=1238182 RepID=K9HHW2_9PROT|nr:ABC transporter permease [Caenispirillum salinarum]EKV30023.1 Spermidine Putrescine ABC transporter permease component PotB [Caenispirillum salinarum AK4]
MSTLAESRRPWLLLSPALGTLSFLLVAPLGFIVVYSFWLRTATGADMGGFHLDNWVEFFTDAFYHDILFYTVRVALITTILCAVVGYIPAYFIANTRMKNKALLLLLLMLPFWISYIIRTLSWINILGTGGAVNYVLMQLGIVNEPLQLLYNEPSVILGLMHYLLPFMILNVYVSLSGIDGNLVAAARTLGATPFGAFLKVTLPLSMPGLAAGSLLCFVLGAGTYITPLILGGPTNAMFANLIFEAIIIQLNWPLGAALSIVLLVVLGTVVTVYGRLMGLNQISKSFG